MKTEELVLNNCSKGEIIEKLGEAFPDIRVPIFAAAFVIKTINLCNLSGFVVSSQDCDSIFVSNLQSD